VLCSLRCYADACTGTQKKAADLYTSCLKPWLCELRLPWGKEEALAQPEPWSALEYVRWAASHPSSRAASLAAQLPVLLACFLSVERRGSMPQNVPLCGFLLTVGRVRRSHADAWHRRCGGSTLRASSARRRMRQLAARLEGATKEQPARLRTSVLGVCCMPARCAPRRCAVHALGVHEQRRGTHAPAGAARQAATLYESLATGDAASKACTCAAIMEAAERFEDVDSLLRRALQPPGARGRFFLVRLGLRRP
jgi:hypothetical protein